jgi:pilus assembly protein Flp/PilA
VVKIVFQQEKAQGLVEYALILVLVAIVVIGILLLLGPVVGNVFSNVTQTLLNPGGSTGPLVSVSAERTGFGDGNDVDVTVVVSRNTTVTLSSTGGTPPSPFACSGTCTKTVLAVGDAAGTVTATAEGQSLSDTYAVKNP